MERAHLGHFLSDISEGRRQFEISQLLEIFLKVCDATSFAHSKEIIHADIKPENIQLDDYGSVLLCDWGLACDLNDENDRRRRRRKGQAQGTPGSMAPEQLSDKLGLMSKQTDIYALGCLLYSFLSGQAPLSGYDLETVIDRTLNGDIPAVSELSHFPVPAALEAVTKKAMALKPEDRYSSVEELVSDIRSYINGFATAAEEAGFWKQGMLFFQRNRLVCSVGGLSIIAITVLVTVFVTKMKESEDKTRSALQQVKSERRQKETVSRLAIPKFLQRAEQAVKSLNLEDARENLEVVLQLDPESELGHYTMGLVFMADFDLRAALFHFEKTPKGHFFMKLCQKVIDGEISNVHMVRILSDRYQENIIGLMLPHIYNDLQYDEKIDFFYSLMRRMTYGNFEPEMADFEPDKKRLTLEGCRLRSTVFLNGLGLKELTIRNSTVNDARSLQKVKLNKLSFEDSMVRNLDDLQFQVSHTLDVSGTNIISHNFFKYHDVHTLNISRTELVWFKRLLDLKNLKVLILSKNQSLGKYEKELQKRVKIVYPENEVRDDP